MNTLLIIKADYLHKRKPVLLRLLQKGFQIQGHRRLLFTPEHAAEFYKDNAEAKYFMLQVILLSKGISEGFILAKDNAVEELISTMVCYFTTSMEMERNVHVTKFTEDVCREISFIFPNYIYEPIPCFQNHKLCANPMLGALISELYEITQRGPDQNRSWKVQLAEWLTLSNRTVPHITNQCSMKPVIGYEEKGQQASAVQVNEPCALSSPPPPTAKDGTAAGFSRSSTERMLSATLSSHGSSAIMSSSSCISCTCFDGTEVCIAETATKVDSCLHLIKPKTAKYPTVEAEHEEEPHICDHIICPDDEDDEDVDEWRECKSKDYGDEEKGVEEGDLQSIYSTPVVIIEKETEMWDLDVAADADVPPPVVAAEEPVQPALEVHVVEPVTEDLPAVEPPAVEFPAVDPSAVESPAEEPPAEVMPVPLLPSAPAAEDTAAEPPVAEGKGEGGHELASATE